MPTPKSEINKFQVYDDSPFPVLNIGTKQVGTPERTITATNKHTGEMTESVQASTLRMVPNDELRYIKLFHHGISAIAGLNQRGISMLLYIATILRPGNNKIELRRTSIASTHPNLSGPAFYFGISELLNAGIIARKSGHPHEYFVNPNIIFTGDRIKLTNQGKKKAKITR